MTGVAVIPVRGGLAPVGADEAIAEAGGRAILIGDDVAAAVPACTTATEVTCVETIAFAPGAWARALVEYIDADIVVLPASPDGRDLAPRLALALDRPFFGGATEVRADQVTLARRGGLVMETETVDGPFVATLVPGVRGVEPTGGAPVVTTVERPLSSVGDARVLAVDPPDPATVDLAEARRIMAGGAGLGGPEWFALIDVLAPAMSASYGATRVASDVGWAPHERYIGTTGVMVDPDLYLAFAISGAVQHVTGLGQPDHIISVNLDASAPMMALADLAIVCDAKPLLAELARRAGVDPALIPDVESV